jgi:hypothetical protein
MTRLTQNVSCSTTTPFPTNADFALLGNWYDLATLEPTFAAVAGDARPITGGSSGVGSVWSTRATETREGAAATAQCT